MRLLTTLLITLALLPMGSWADINLGDPTQLPTPEGGKYTMPSFSPDCRNIAFAKKDYSGLYVSDWQGKFNTIAEAPLAGWRYSWSPDGNSLAYRVRYEDTPALAGMVASADGSGQTQVTDWQNDLFPPQWGGKGITFKAGDDMLTVDNAGQVKSVKSLSNGKGIVSRVAAFTASFFANGLIGATATAFAALVPAASGKGNPKDIITDSDNRLWVADENGEMKQLLDIKDESGYFSPQIAPTGDAVAAPGLSGKLYVAGMDGQYTDLGMGQDPTWSPDGRYLIFEVVKEDGHDITGSDLWIASRDGKWRKQLTYTDAIERYPSWSPDGRTLAYEIDGKIFYAPIDQK